MRCSDAVADPPSGTSGNGTEPSTERLCRKCGTAATADENSCRSCGAFLPSNQAALRHGARRQLMVDPEDSPLFDAWAADLGGVDNLSTAARALLRRAAEADLVCATALTYAMESKKSLTSAEVQAALNTLKGHAGTILRVATLLGVDPTPQGAWR